MVYIGKGKTEQRALHWSEIKSRVTTHEGEMLSGSKGKSYQDKYSKQYLGKDMTGRYKIDSSVVEQYEKTKK